MVKQSLSALKAATQAELPGLLMMGFWLGCERC